MTKLQTVPALGSDTSEGDVLKSISMFIEEINILNSSGETTTYNKKKENNPYKD